MGIAWRGIVPKVSCVGCPFILEGYPWCVRPFDRCLGVRD